MKIKYLHVQLNEIYHYQRLHHPACRAQQRGRHRQGFQPPDACPPSPREPARDGRGVVRHRPPRAFEGGGRGEGGVESTCIADTSSLIHEFYADECDDDPIHLVVDTGLRADAVPLRTYKSIPVCVRVEPLANMFHEIRLSLSSSESERICVDRMIGHASDPGGAPASQDEGATLQRSIERLLSILEACSEYVDGVVDGSISPNDEMGRDISETLSSVPRIRTEVFDKMFNDSLQDLLMVTYLSNITKTQLLIPEKFERDVGEVGKRVWYLSLVFDITTQKYRERERREKERAEPIAK
jgi:hypothetical protein